MTAQTRPFIVKLLRTMLQKLVLDLQNMLKSQSEMPQSHEASADDSQVNTTFHHIVIQSQGSWACCSVQ